MSGFADDDEEGGDGENFFEEGFDAVTLLDQMGHHQQGSSFTEQPFEVLKRAIGGETFPQAEACFNKHSFRLESISQPAAFPPSCLQRGESAPMASLCVIELMPSCMLPGITGTQQEGCQNFIPGPGVWRCC